MLLQPIVENSIIHGLEPSPESGHISVSAHLEDDSLVMTVEDNGVGCDLAQIESGVGSTNVRERIQLYFGEAASIRLESAPDHGTRVRIRVPAGEMMTG
jgi:two-component system sensor histidine kinase YesM